MLTVNQSSVCLAALLVGMALGGAMARDRAWGGEPRLNQIQVIGTHNSYRLAPLPPIQKLIAAARKRDAEALDYEHRPLAEQFTRLGVRQIELDLYADPKGGLFASPSALKMIRGKGNEPGPPFDEAGLLKKPGLKVLHIPDIDYRTTVPTFLIALRQIRDWSQAHRDHAPILVLVELKDESIPALPTRPIPFGAAELDAVDAEIRSVFTPLELLTPDRLRGRHSSLVEAIRVGGWPMLDACRGLVFFALDNEGAIRDRYLDGHPSLRGRVMFATVDSGDPAAAWFKINDPVAHFDRIQQLVCSGYLVRTRADADTRQARTGDVTMRDKALASGAQFISTDYPVPDPRFPSYSVRFGGGIVVRSNPVTGDPAWKGVDLERKPRPGPVKPGP